MAAASCQRTETASRARAREWACALLVALLFYSVTAARTIQWQDYGHFVQRVVDGELVTYLGLALAHPLHYWLSRGAVVLLPLEPPHSVALISALFGALAVANIFGIVREITGRGHGQEEPVPASHSPRATARSSAAARLIPAALAAGGLALGHTWWRMSTMPECYTVTVALLTAEVWALVRWDHTRRPHWLVAMFLANGLGLANHNLALLTLPVIGSVLLIAWRHTITWRTVIGCALAWLAGASLYLGLVLAQVIETGQFAATIHSALFGTGFRQNVAAVRVPVRHLAVSLAFTVLSFPNLTLPLALLGLTRRRPGGLTTLSFRALLAALVIHLLFVLRYDVIDQYTFLLPAYALLAIFAGVGIHAAQERWPAHQRGLLLLIAIPLILTPALYLAAAPLARRLDALGTAVRNKPYRDDYHYLLTPWGISHTSAQRMSQQAIDLASPAGVIIVEDGMALFAIQYQLTRHSLTDVDVLRSTQPQTQDAQSLEAAVAAGRRVVLVPARVDTTPALPSPGLSGYFWQREGDLYVLMPSPSNPR